MAAVIEILAARLGHRRSLWRLRRSRSGVRARAWRVFRIVPPPARGTAQPNAVVSRRQATTTSVRDTVVDVEALVVEL